MSRHTSQFTIYKRARSNHGSLQARLLETHRVLLCTVATIILIAQASWPTRAKEGRRAPDPALPAAVDLAALDRRADPCADFYQFACGGWVAQHPLPADRRAFGRFTELQDQNFALLRRILETPRSGTVDSDRMKAADFYAACLDEQAIESKGLTPLTPDLVVLGNLRNPDDLPVAIAHLHEIGVAALFRFGGQIDRDDATRIIAVADQGGLGLPDRDYYIKTDDRSVQLRAKYLAHVEAMLGAAGEGPEEAAADARAAVTIETTLARASLDRVKRRDPASTHHRTTIGDLQARTPSFDWKKYLAAAGAPAVTSLNVASPEFFSALERLLAATSLEDLKSYMRWQLLNAAARMLPKRFADASFDFFDRTLAGQQEQEPRWRRCVSETDRYLGDALGKAFIEEAFSAQSKTDALKMVQEIKRAMRQDIESATWMGSDTKRAATTKLDAVVDRIGYPEVWRDYSALTVSRDDALGNELRARGFNRNRDLRKIGHEVDRTEWGMTPPTVNAYYSPDRNNINFPAGILQPPFYRAGRDAAVNYGAAGAVIGHELTHGFDDSGRHFDGAGNLRNWWTDADSRAFEERAACMADQYSSYTVAGDTHVNGRLTLGENAGDNGGLRLALTAYEHGPGATSHAKVDGFSPEQRVFLGWAQVWCENARPEAERLKAQTNPHASNRYRVNGPASNMAEFQKAFQCKAGSPMVRQNPCRIW